MAKHTVDEISKIDWQFWHVRKRPALLIYFFYHGATCRASKDFPYYIHTSGQIVDHVVTSKKELEEFRKKAWEKFQKEPDFVLRFMNQLYEQNREHILLWREIAKTDYSQQTQEQLLEAYNTYVEQLLSYSPAIYLPLALEPVLSDECWKLLKQKTPQKAQEWYDCIMTPVKESEIIEERKSFLRIAQKWNKKKNEKEIKQELKDHVERFSFLKRKDMFMEFFDEKYYLEEMKRCRNSEEELLSLESETEKKKKEFQEVLDLFKEDPFAQILFKTTNEAIFFRTWRTERFSQSSSYIVSLFQEIAHCLRLQDYHDILYLLPPELVDLLKNNKLVNQRLIEQRKEAFTYITFGSKEQLVLQGKDAQEPLTYLHLFDTSHDNIRGTPAFKGNVQGKVVVITHRDQWPSIQHAEILVIHTTTPDIVPYLKKVKGIVTEEGGILSHASVISREMKIPCVIGTKIATKAFKSGDVVEVDAEKGIVRKIK